MYLAPLQKTVILIDVDYLNSTLEATLKKYSHFPLQELNAIKLADLLYTFAAHSGINQRGQNMDVHFAYVLSNSNLYHCSPADVFEFIDVNHVSLDTSIGNFLIKSFYADEDESCDEHFQNMLEEILLNAGTTEVVLVGERVSLSKRMMARPIPGKSKVTLLTNGKVSNGTKGVNYVSLEYAISRCLSRKADQ